MVSRCGAVMSPGSVLQKRSTTTDGGSAGKVTIIAAMEAASARGVMSGRSKVEGWIPSTSTICGGGGGVRGRVSHTTSIITGGEAAEAVTVVAGLLGGVQHHVTLETHNTCVLKLNTFIYITFQKQSSHVHRVPNY